MERTKEIADKIVLNGCQEQETHTNEPIVEKKQYTSSKNEFSTPDNNVTKSMPFTIRIFN